MPLNLSPGAVMVTLLTWLLVPAAPGAQTPERWSLEPAGELGALDGPAVLTRVSTILPDQRNPDRAWIGQPSDRHIKLIDIADGSVVHVLGRPGEGPGEIRSLGRLAWHHDTLVVADRDQQRLILFTPDGRHVRTERIASGVLASARRRAVGVALTPSGDAWAEPSVSMLLVASNIVTQLPVLTLRRDGGIRRPVVHFDLSGSMSSVDYGTGVSVFVQPLTTRTLHAFAPDGAFLVVVSDTSDDRFSVVRIDENGDTAFHRYFSYSPRPVTAEQRDSILAAYSLNFGRGKSAAEALELAQKHVRVPETQPPVSAVIVSSNSEIWLRREELDMGSEWIVLGPDGRLRAYATAPSGTRILAVTDEYAWGVTTREYDVPYVLRFRITRQEMPRP